MSKYPTQSAYEYSLSEFLTRCKKYPDRITCQKFCSSCGEQTCLHEEDEERGDRICSRCRSWKYGVFAWILHYFGWELNKVKKK